jgi:hypothetical protein
LVGYGYDASGNMTNDTFHTYIFDAEGNITAVDGGPTATYVYNAQNQRVRATVGSTSTEYVFSAAGQRVSEWNRTTRAQFKGKYYWDAKPVAYNSGNATHFEHQDWSKFPATGLHRWGLVRDGRMPQGCGRPSAMEAVKHLGRADKF